MDYDELVQRLRVWSLDERRGDGMLLVRTSNAIVALQARVAELEQTNSARVDQAERERDAAIAVVDANWVTHQQIVAVRAERDALRALLQKLRGAVRLYRGGGVAGQQMGNESYSILVTGHTLGDIDAALAESK